MTKRVAVINDLSAFGKCSLTASIAVLSVMGHTPCPLPTAVLSHQSEIGNAYCADLTESMPYFADAWQKNGERFDGIITGYFSSGEQLEHAQRVIDTLRGKMCTVIVDPVMGDNGRLYPAYDKTACESMKRLASAADIITPNLTELCMLTDTDFFDLTARQSEANYLDRVAALAKSAARGEVIVTGVSVGNEICNVAVSGGSAKIIRSAKIDERFSGTGDIFSAVVCGCMLNGKTVFEAAEIAAAFVYRCVADTVTEPHDPLYGVNFEKNLRLLTEVNHFANNSGRKNEIFGQNTGCHRHVCGACHRDDRIY